MWWGQEFVTNRGTVDSLKVWMTQAGAGPTSEGDIMACRHENLGNAALLPTNFGIYADQWGQDSSNIPPGCSDNDPYTPTGPGAAATRTHQSPFNKWVRSFLEIKINVDETAFDDWETFRQTVSREIAANPAFTMPAGTYDQITWWDSDEDTDAELLLDHAPATIRVLSLSGNKPRPYYTTFRWGWDCSTVNNKATGGSAGMSGPWVGYGRNFMVFYNLSETDRDAMLARRPVA